MQRIFLAIDIGASSGRHIVGIEADGALQTDEVYRFPNGMQRENGHLIWDIEGIFQHVKAGIKAAFAKYPHIDSLSIDTWAVDYVLLKDGAALLPCHAYRDRRISGSYSFVAALTSPVEVAFVYSRAFTPQSRYSRYSGTIRKSSACCKRPVFASS